MIHTFDLPTVHSADSYLSTLVLAFTFFHSLHGNSPSNLGCPLTYLDNVSSVSDAAVCGVRGGQDTRIVGGSNAEPGLYYQVLRESFFYAVAMYNIMLAVRYQLVCICFIGNGSHFTICSIGNT